MKIKTIKLLLLIMCIIQAAILVLFILTVTATPAKSQGYFVMFNGDTVHQNADRTITDKPQAKEVSLIIQLKELYMVYAKVCIDTTWIYKRDKDDDDTTSCLYAIYSVKKKESFYDWLLKKVSK